MDENKLKPMAATLPDEILLKIVKACVEPYTLRVHQGVYGLEKIQGYFTDLERYGEEHPFSRRPQPESDEDTDFCLNSTTLVVRGFTTDGNLEYLDGLPKVTNIKLVNKKFNDEVTLTMSAKFDGRVSVVGMGDFFHKSNVADWRPYSQPLSTGPFSWIYPLMTHISVNEYSKLPLLAIVKGGMTPNLQRLTIFAGGYEKFVTWTKDVMDDEHDFEFAIQVQRDLFFFTEPWFALDAVKTKDIELLVEFDIATRAYPRVDQTFRHKSTTYMTPSTWCRLTIKLTASGSCVFQARQQHFRK